MKNNLKIAIPIGVLMAIIFGITFFSRYAPEDDGGTKGTAQAKEPPLRFFTSSRSWDPFGSPQDRIFPGFYELQRDAAGQPNAAAFWFENRNDKSVTMQLHHVSCNACSGARLAPIPPDVSRQILQMTAVSSLPGGLFSPFPTGMVGPAANLRQLEWQGAAFRDNPKAEYKVPAAANTDGWSPQWGILELRFSVGVIGPKPIEADFNVQVDGTQQIGTAKFKIAFVGVEAFDLSLDVVEVGELEETSSPTQHEVIVYSSTRGPNTPGGDDLRSLKTAVELPNGVVGESGPFVTISEPVRIPESEYLNLAEKMHKPVRIEDAYRYTITVSPKVGDKRVDLGPLERDIHISTPDFRKTVRIRGTVRGSVWLGDNQRAIDLRAYKFESGTAPPAFDLHTDKPDQELVLVKDDPAVPEKVELRLEKQPPAPDRGNYKLHVSVPPGAKSGSWSGFVVLELKGPPPQRIRIPIKGNGTR
ncbi:MAG: hypothetical protein U0792_09960 [Gemmataceae bacterium]